MRKQPKDKGRLRKETLRKLSNGELSMVAGGPEAQPRPTTDCPYYSCMISCPVNTGVFPNLR